jgi:hypothetical protein
MVCSSFVASYDKVILCNFKVVHNFLVILFVQIRWNLENNDDENARIWKIAKERYKGWRAQLSSTFKAYNSYHQRVRHKPEELEIVEWHYLVLYFKSDKF